MRSKFFLFKIDVPGIWNRLLSRRNEKNQQQCPTSVRTETAMRRVLPTVEIHGWAARAVKLGFATKDDANHCWLNTKRFASHDRRPNGPFDTFLRDIRSEKGTI